MLQKWLQEAGYNCIVGSTIECAWQELQDSANMVSVAVTDAGHDAEVGKMEDLCKQNVSVIMLGASEGAEHGSYAFVARPLVKKVLLCKVDMLEHQRQTELHYRKENAVLRKQIDALSGRFFRTPMDIIVNSIKEILAAPGLAEDLRPKIETLGNLITQNSKLYHPTVPQKTNYDPVTRSFLLGELSLFVPSTEFARALSGIDIDEQVVLQLTEWTFDAFKQSEDSLAGLVTQMFVHLDLLVHFNIRVDVLERFLTAVRQMYNPNPYHNWIHAFDVTQATFCYLIHFDGLSKLSRLDWLTLLVSALCHDLSHPGVNNAHQVMAQTDLAVLYNDRSVLENFHTASLFQLLQQREELNIFATLTKQQFREVRKSITDCILATDMANHYEYVSKLRIKYDSSSPQWDCNAADQRALLMQCIIKMADINNVARPWEVSVEWSRRVSKEFFAQGLPLIWLLVVTFF
jgi:hypothetical protein